MNIVKLDVKERWTHHNRYRENDLFRHWERVFYECEQYTEIDATSLWKHALSVLQMLKDTPSYREEMVGFLMNEMERVNPIRQVEAVMAIVLTQLANAPEEGHTHEPQANDTMCISILLRYGDEDGFLRRLIDRHKQLRLGYDGKKVVIAPHDPMTEETTLDSLPQATQESIEAKQQRVSEKTQGLKLYFGSEWDNWEKLWRQILMDEEFYVLIDNVNPRKNAWGMNLKMVANVMGMFNTARDIKVAASRLNSCLDGSDRNSYISRCMDYANRTHCALNEAQGNRIKGLIKAL